MPKVNKLFPVEAKLSGKVASCFLAESCTALNMQVHLERPIRFKGYKAPPLFFFSFCKKNTTGVRINHNVLYQPLGDIARKRAVITRGLGVWKNGSWCHKANSL